MNPTEAFLRALFEHLPPGFIELRILEDRKGGRLLARRWYPDATALIDILPKMTAYTEENHAGIFFGVLPRRADGVGKAHDALPGFATWTDLDFRDYQEGEGECIKKLNHFPLDPTALVRSGHGLHAYWFFKEPEEPHVLVELSARLASFLGGDHVADAARILRMPGTTNCKNPKEPLPVVIESMDLDRRYITYDLDDFLPSLPAESQRQPALDIVVGDDLSKRVQKLLKKHPRLRNLFEGKGKPATDEHGHRLDTTSSGYDYSFACALVRKGVTGEAELATALWRRPDDAARTKGTSYILRTVRRALSKVTVSKRSRSGKGKDEKEEKIDFVVDHVRIFDSNPRIYELIVKGVPISLSTSEILSPTRFSIRFTDALSRVPELPSGRIAWREQVNTWLAQAEIVEQPPEASAGELLREQILQAIDDLALGESVKDLDQSKALKHDGDLIFKTLTLLKILKDTHGEVRSHVLCSHLRDLGFVSKTVRVEGKVARVWTSTTASSTEEASPPEAVT